MVVKRIALGLFVLILCADSAARGATRVALVAPKPSAPMRKIIPLAEVRLGQESSLQLVEREQVQKLLAEQEASLSGLVRAENAIAAGRVISTDILAVVGDSDNLVIFDAVSGLRLFDAAIPTQEGEKAAGIIAVAIVQAAAKRAQMGQELRTVCLLSVRNGDLPRGMDSFCDAVGRLFEREMLTCPTVALLERARLDQINKERALAPVAWGADLMKSVTTVDLEIGGLPDGGVRVSALLGDVSGKHFKKVTGDLKQPDAAKLARAMSEGVAKMLKTDLGMARTSAFSEAWGFYREAGLMSAHQDYSHALPAIEAAHALMPEDVVFQAVLARTLVEYGHAEYLNRLKGKSDAPPFAPGEVPPWVGRGADILLTVKRRAPGAPEAARKIANGHMNACITLLIAHAQKVRSSIPRRPGDHGATSPQLMALQDVMHRYRYEEHAHELAQMREKGWPDRYCLHTDLVAENLFSALARDSHQWSTELLALTEEFFRERDARETEAGTETVEVLLGIASSWKRGDHPARPRDSIESAPMSRIAPDWQLDAQDYQRLEAIAARMEAHASPTIQLIARLARLTTEIDRCGASTAKMNAKVAEFIAAIKPLLEKAGIDDDYRRACYRLMIDADRMTGRTDKSAGAFSIDIMNFMLARKDVIESVLLRGGMATQEQNEADWPARQRPYFARIRAVIDAPDARILKGDLMTLRAAHPLPGERADTTIPLVEHWKWKTISDVFFAGNGIQWIFCPVIEKDGLYAAGLQRGSAANTMDLHLLHFDLTTNRQKTLGGVTFKGSFIRFPADTRSGGAFSFAPGACVHDGHYAIATKDGLYIFPLNGAPGFRIDVDTGFPASPVSAVAGLGGKLYAGVGNKGKEGYLVSYDLKSKAIEVLASSLRKVVRSPLDDASPFAVPFVFADPARARIVAGIQREEPRKQVNGIWEYVPKTQKWRKTLEMWLGWKVRPTPTENLSINLLSAQRFEPNMLAVATNREMFTYNLETDTAEYLIGWEPKLPEYPTSLPEGIKVRHSPLPEKLEIGKINAAVRFPFIMVDEWIVNGYGSVIARTSLTTEVREEISNPRSPEIPFRPRYFQRISPTQILVGDVAGLYILSCPPGAADKPAK